MDYTQQFLFHQQKVLGGKIVTELSAVCIIQLASGIHCHKMCIRQLS